MDVLERASEVDDAVHLAVGEPDFDPPEAVFDAAVDSLRAGNTDYTAARGKPELRDAIAARYDREYDVDVDPDRVVVTPGSDFGERASDYVRLSYATDTESIKVGARRIETLLKSIER